MTSLLHLGTVFKPIQPRLTQPYLPSSPPSNAFPHLPRPSACPTPPRASIGHPSCGTLTTLWWVCSAAAQLDLASAWSQRDTRSKATAPRRAALHRGYVAAEGSWHRTFVLGWSFLLLQSLLHQPDAPEPMQILHSASLTAPERKPPQHQLPPQTPGYHQPGPPVLNSYLNGHFKPTTALPPPEKGWRCYTTTSLRGITSSGVRVQT